jgi:hypothetical protein
VGGVISIRPEEYKRGRPKFCYLCGLALIEDNQGYERYDMYTGDLLAPANVKLRCPRFQYIKSDDPRESDNGHTKVFWQTAWDDESIRTQEHNV